VLVATLCSHWRIPDALLSCHRYGEILPPVQSNLATCQIQRSAAARRFRSEQTGSKVRIARQPPRTPKSGNFSAAVFAECVGDLATVEEFGPVSFRIADYPGFGCSRASRSELHQGEIAWISLMRPPSPAYAQRALVGPPPRLLVIAFPFGVLASN
jgi:hypothetical protein